MEARVARFDKLQTYQRQNFEAYDIPPGAVEKVAARRVYPVMAPADYQGRSAGAPVKGQHCIGSNKYFDRAQIKHQKPLPQCTANVADGSIASGAVRGGIQPATAIPRKRT